MLVGLAAGALALVFGYLFGEPAIDQAIAFEDSRAQAAGEIAGPELVSRAVQSTVGLATALLAFGAAIGGLYGLAFAVAYGRIGRFGARATAALVALGGFVSIELAVFIKYPTNPPAVGNPDTIGSRSGLYFLMMAISVAAAIGAVWTGQRLQQRLGNWNATLAACGAYLLVLVLAYLLLPAVNEAPDGFPASTLWNFRVASLGTQLVVWSTMGLLFGALSERYERVRALQRAAA